MLRGTSTEDLVALGDTISEALPVGPCGVISSTAQTAKESTKGWTTEDLTVFAVHFDRQVEGLEGLTQTIAGAMKAIASSWEEIDRQLADSAG